MEAISLYLLLPFAILLVLGVPIAFALGLGCIAFIALADRPIPFSIIITEMSAGLDSYALLALPTFVMTGELLNRTGMTEKLTRLAMSLVGWVRGGLAHVTVVAGMLLSCISGSAIADTATLGSVMVPAMVRERFPPAFAAAVAGSAAVIGAIIPPSVPLVIIGSQLGISVGGLFLAGILPGILTGLALMATAWLIARRRGYGVVHPFPGPKAAALDTGRALPVLAIPLIILGGILGGVFSPTEAGAIAVAYAMLLGGLYYRTLTLPGLRSALLTSARITASALIIVAISLVFGRLLAYEQVPQALLAVITGVTENSVLLVLILIAFFLFVGTFMDSVAAMIILGPLLMPLALQGLDMHPFQYGMFLMYGLLLGILTPPLAPVLYIVAPIANVTAEQVAVAILPFFGAMVLVLALVAFVPGLTTWLPLAAGYK